MVKNLPAVQETQVRSLGWKDRQRRKWQPTPVFLPGEFHGQRSLASYSPWGRIELDTTELLTLSLSVYQLITQTLHDRCYYLYFSGEKIEANQHSQLGWSGFNV